MTSPQPRRTSRIEARVTPERLSILRRAAEIEGRSLSDFVVAAAQDAAEQTIRKSHILQLSLADQERLAEILERPPAKSPALDRALAAHRELIREGR
jgi:uncharacterized protein (DUF1778 family)